MILFNFNGQYTGNPLGDFLWENRLAEELSVSYNKGRAETLRRHTPGRLADPPAMSRCRSACAGSRSSRSTKSTNRNPSSGPVSSRPCSKRAVRLAHAGDPGVPRGGHPTLWTNVAPRLAASWSLNKKTIVRTAYGKFHDTARFFHFPKTLVFTPPYSMSRTTNDVQFSDPYAGTEPVSLSAPESSHEFATYQYQPPVRVTSYPDNFSGELPSNRTSTSNAIWLAISSCPRHMSGPRRRPPNHAANKPRRVRSRRDTGDSSTEPAVPPIRKHLRASIRSADPGTPVYS